MNNTQIVIDPGHGGVDPGAVGSGIIEKDLNLAISEYMYNRFRDLGVPVKITRATDITLPPDKRVQTILEAFGNEPNVLVISNHINATGGDGAEVIYALRDPDNFAELIAEEIEKEGQNVRKWYQRRLPSNPELDYYFIHRETGITEPVIVEYGFLDSPADDVTQLKNNFRGLAEAVVRATARYKNIPYTPPTGENIYVVKSGDTLYSIARKFNVSVDTLIEVNNLTSPLLSLGQILIIPEIEVEEPTPTPGEYTVYTVKAGDNLYSIARAFNTTVDELISLNNLATINLSLGQQLLIPGTYAPTPPAEEEYTVYTVQAGDNLYSIARTFNTTVNAIMELNNLTTTSLSLGQRLLIPRAAVPEEPTPPPTEYTVYTVQAGDNLYAIARTFNTTVNAIMELNNLATTNLSIGQQLLIPTEVIEEPLTPSEPTPNVIEYVVKSGDNLWDIARRFNVSVTTIKEYNNLTNNLLSIGQVLRIPIAEEYQTYYVTDGDNLYSIARTFGTTVEEIKRVNNLTTNILSLGQKLLIPIT